MHYSETLIESIRVLVCVCMKDIYHVYSTHASMSIDTKARVQAEVELGLEPASFFKAREY